jgi:hypothetical protein
MGARDQRTVVVSVDLWVDVVSPTGDTVVPLELDLLVSVTTPLTLDVCWLLVETAESDGIGARGVVVDCVVVELEEELCARATPVVNVTAIVAASKVLIMVGSPGELGAGGDRSLFALVMWHLRCTDGRLGNYSTAPVVPGNQLKVARTGVAA